MKTCQFFGTKHAAVLLTGTDRFERASKRHVRVAVCSTPPDFTEPSLSALSIAALFYVIDPDASGYFVAVALLSLSATAIGFGRHEWRQRFPSIPVAAPVVLLEDTGKTLFRVILVPHLAQQSYFGQARLFSWPCGCLSRCFKAQ